MADKAFRLAELAAYLGAQQVGDTPSPIRRLASLELAGPDAISFVAQARYEKLMHGTSAGALVVNPALSATCPVPHLVMANPYLGFARLARLFSDEPRPDPGIHPTAVVAAGARIAPGASIGPYCVIESGAEIGEGAIIGAQVYIGEQVRIGEGCRIWPQVSIYYGTRIGRDCIIHSGAVIGADGFGFAADQGQWHKIPQLGRVILGNGVEVGANSAIDRGALEDTCIGDGVKIDDLVMVAHNVRIGAHSALAGCVGIAGSAEIGAHCTIGGGAGVAGHLRVADKVQITGMTLVAGNIETPGSYSSGTSHMPSSEWRKSVVRFRQLDDMARRLKQLEQRLASLEGRQADTDP